MNSNHESENDGCLVFLLFPVVSSWVWIATAILDIRFWLGGLLGTAVFVLIFLKTRTMKYTWWMFTLVLTIICLIAMITNLLVGCSLLMSILIPIGMLSGIVVIYKLYYDIENNWICEGGKFLPSFLMFIIWFKSCMVW